MTKVIILGQEPEKNGKGAIQFVKFLVNDLTFYEASSAPDTYKVIEVVCAKYADGFDLFFAYSGDRTKTGVLYLGHYNDGIVE